MAQAVVLARRRRRNTLRQGQGQGSRRPKTRDVLRVRRHVAGVQRGTAGRFRRQPNAEESHRDRAQGTRRGALRSRRQAHRNEPLRGRREQEHLAGLLPTRY